MKKFFVMFLGAVLGFMSPAQARTFNQAELDALLAPVALYPDPLLSQVLVAATYPQDVAEAAAWSRANPHLTGEQAVRAAEPYPWDPGVKSLLAFPEVLARMDESPQWTLDLGQAFLAYEPYVMDTVQALRRRAHAAGHLRSDAYHAVEQHGPTITVVPVQPHVVYVPYYSPYVVYGPWWWPHHRPVLWRAWRPAPTVVSANFHSGRPDWHRRKVVIRDYHYHRVPEAQRQPIVRSHSLPPAQRIETPRRHEHRLQERRNERPRDTHHGVRFGHHKEHKAPKEQRREVKEQRRDAHHGKDRQG